LAAASTVYLIVTAFQILVFTSTSSHLPSFEALTQFIYHCMRLRTYWVENIPEFCEGLLPHLCVCVCVCVRVIGANCQIIVDWT